MEARTGLSQKTDQAVLSQNPSLKGVWYDKTFWIKRLIQRTSFKPEFNLSIGDFHHNSDEEGDFDGRL